MKAKTQKRNSIIILGSGTSTGTPILGCSCKVCHSKNSKDKRYRTSFLIKTSEGKNILIDTTPDMRTQLLREKIKKIDTAIITHEHADHLHGIDDLRPFCFSPGPHSIPIHTSKICADIMRERFPYIFQWEKFYTEDKPIIGGGIPRLDLHDIQVTEDNIVKKQIEGKDFYFFLIPHGYGFAMGFVQGSLGYIGDCHSIPEFILSFLKKRKLDLLIMNCVQKEKHQSHLTVDASFAYIKKIQPKRAGLIHMNHFLGHAELTKLCKEYFTIPVGPLFDGQKLYY